MNSSQAYVKGPATSTMNAFVQYLYNVAWQLVSCLASSGSASIQVCHMSRLEERICKKGSQLECIHVSPTWERALRQALSHSKLEKAPHHVPTAHLSATYTDAQSPSPILRVVESPTFGDQGTTARVERPSHGD